MPRSTTPEPALYRFRVRIVGGYYAPPEAKSIWREIEIAANQTLQELGEEIPYAFDFDDPHLWSFFLSGKPWDKETEYAIDTPFEVSDDESMLASQVRIRDVPYPGVTGKKEFLFLFDYGDEWYFGVKLVALLPAARPRARYPRVVAKAGKAPPQYPMLEEEEDEADEE